MCQSYIRSKLTSDVWTFSKILTDKSESVPKVRVASALVYVGDLPFDLGGRQFIDDQFFKFSISISYEMESNSFSQSSKAAATCLFSVFFSDPNVFIVT